MPPYVLRLLGALAAYPLLALALPPEPLYLIVNTAMLAFAAAVVVAFAPSVREALTARERAVGHHLVVGIFLAWLSDVLLRAYVGAFRVLDRPDWMTDHPVIGHVPGFFLAIGLAGAVLHITVPDEIDGRIPRRHWVLIGLAVAAILLAAGILAVIAARGPP